MISSDQMLSLVRQRGPVIPKNLTKDSGTSTLFVSAVLSELASNKKIRISNIKVGGSPLYYVEGQDAKLANYANYLNEKEKRAFDLLKQERVLLDEEQEPLTRVCLRQIKDFAIPITVSLGGQERLFWKWFLLSNEEVQSILKERYTPKEEPKTETKIEADPAPVEEKIKEEQQEKKEEPKTETQEKTTPKQEKRKSQERSKITSDVEPKKETQQSLPSVDDIDDPFFDRIKAFCKKEGISIISAAVNRKGSDIDMTLRIPSPIGDLTYFTKAKSKKTVNDGDISAAFLASQAKQLPALMIVEGALTKKAESLLAGQLKGMAIKRI